MVISIIVKRQASISTQPYMEKFVYEGDGQLTVAQWLREVNCGEAKRNRIAWECGCGEKKCGACAMVINKSPMLACSVRLKEAVKGRKIVLEPLSKFPLVKDLMVDRTSMFEALKAMHIWLEEKEWSDFSWNRELQYKAGQCLQCGCCLEICPNFVAENGFSGAAAMVAAYKAIEQNVKGEHRSKMQQEYKKQFYSHCGQALSCQKVCPMKLPLDEIQARVNKH